jgi:hypothetical protein
VGVFERTLRGATSHKVIINIAPFQQDTAAAAAVEAVKINCQGSAPGLRFAAEIWWKSLGTHSKAASVCQPMGISLPLGVIIMSP